jgi:hypothetical protein
MPMFTLHTDTFAVPKPNETQLKTIDACMGALAECASDLDAHLPPGPDKTYALRKLREVGMWCIESATKHPDGTPRE